jgi:hypothetical protein
MNLNYLEEVTEKILLEFGITPDEYDGLIIFLLSVAIAYSVGSWVYFRIRCRNISCENLSKIVKNSEKVRNNIAALEEILKDLHHIDSTDHSNIKDNIDKVDSALSDVKSKVSELNGIMLVRGTYSASSRRRIEHEDD